MVSTVTGDSVKVVEAKEAVNQRKHAKRYRTLNSKNYRK